jgi:hypothetical protein
MTIKSLGLYHDKKTMVVENFDFPQAQTAFACTNGKIFTHPAPTN